MDLNSGIIRRGYITSSLFNFLNNEILDIELYYKSILDKKYTMTPLSTVRIFLMHLPLNISLLGSPELKWNRLL